MFKRKSSISQSITSSSRRMSERGLVIWSVALIAILLSLPAWGTSNLLRTLVEFMGLLALAQMWNLLAGYAGLISVGQQAWIGLGGYALLVLADDLGVNMFLAALLAGVVAALLALLTAPLIFRLRAGYFAIGTWVLAEVFRLLVASSTDWLRGGSGRSLAAAGALDRAMRENLTYWLAVVIGLGSIALVYYLVRSRTGLGLTAIRDSEVAAASVGVNTYRIKLLVFVICAFYTGIVGGLIYLNVLRITPDAAFTVQWSAFMIFIVVIGGIGTIEGPIIGAVIFFLIREYLSAFGGWSFILLGTVAIVLMLFAPQGVWGFVQQRFDLELFPVRRRLPPHLLEAEPVPLEQSGAVKEPV